MLTDVQKRILAEIEEAGSDRLMEFINVTQDRTGSPRELEDVVEAIDGLIDRGLLVLAKDRDAERRLVPLDAASSKIELTKLKDRMFFDAEKRAWRDRTYIKPPFMNYSPYVVATAEGLRVADEILRTHDYRWWRAPGNKD